MLENIEVLCHSSIKISKEKVIYIDPYKIDRNYNDADIIVITHNHYDHYSKEDIKKVKKDSTFIVGTEDLLDKFLKDDFTQDNIKVVCPNNVYEIDKIMFETIPAYNTNKLFHPKKNGWVGYVIEIDDIKYYIAGDTDITEENRKVRCDIAFVPVRWNLYNECKESSRACK